MRYLCLFVFCFCLFAESNYVGAASSETSKSSHMKTEYRDFLLKKVGQQLPQLVDYPFFTYPNEGHEILPAYFPAGKVRVFGYGSLMNKLSAARSIKADAIETMAPAIAFGVKRLFNYKAKYSPHWSEEQHRKERAMLNLTQTLNIASMANGVTIEVELEDLVKLVSRETGYDLVPILVASWEDVMAENPQLEIRVAYTFVATSELRDHINYTSTEFYPVRGYLHAVQDASLAYGEQFAKVWNATTFLANGTTSIDEWDGVTFEGVLCTQTP